MPVLHNRISNDALKAKMLAESETANHHFVL